MTSSSVESPEVPSATRALASRLVELVPVESDASAEFVYHLYCTDESGQFLRFGGIPPSRDVFASDVLSSAFDHAVARFAIGDRRSIGYIRCDNVDRAAWHGTLSVALDAPWQRRSLVFALGAHYIDRLFRCWPFNKIYFHMPEYNVSKFPSFGVGRIHVEAVLEDHLFFDGRRWSMVVASLSREAWEEHLRDGTVAKGAAQT